MTESQVIAILGKPKEETENDGEKIYSYNEMSIGFEKLDDNNRPSGSGVYKVTQAASIGSDDKFSRNMRVGQSADDILKCIIEMQIIRIIFICLKTKHLLMESCSMVILQ